MAPYDCSRDPKVHLYSFLNKLGHFLQTRYNFRRKKNCKNGKSFAKIFKTFEININHLNTLPVQILGHLDHFWPKMTILSIFGPYFALLIYKGMWRPAVIPPLALSAITFEPLVQFKKSWAFWKALAKGYLMVSKWKNLKKSAWLPPGP